MREYDLAIIGAGPGGYTSAIYASRSGLKTCLIEHSLVGGTCLNRGCIPTKVILHGAKLLSSIRDAAHYGVEVQACKFSPERLFAKRDEVVARLRGGVLALLKANKIDLIAGSGKLKTPDTIEVGAETIRARNVIIATGSSPRDLEGLKFDGATILSSEDVLKMADLPKSVLVIGGGVIGCEFSQFYNTVGSKVTIVEMMERLLPAQDAQIGRRLEAIFKRRGIQIHTSAKVADIKAAGRSVAAKLSSGAVIECEAALVSIGRTLNSRGLGLEEAGVATDKGRIVVNEFLETSAKGIYAIGDVMGGPMLAHAASYEGMVACDNILGKPRRVDYRIIPSCIYTDPEIATCGIQEDEAKKMPLDYKAVKFPYLACGKAHVLSKTDGFIKIIGEKGGKVLGIEIFGEGACDLIGEASLAISSGATVRELAGAVHGHPTLSEMFGEAAHLFLGKPIHTT